MRLGVTLAAALYALALAPLAQASFIVDRNASDVTLRVSGGTALVSYRTRGLQRHVALSGAIDARPTASGAPQVSFHAVYGSGAARGGACRAYDGPPLAFLVAACKAPDGSYWALQAWQRLLPNYGGADGAWELHASHWSGPLPKLEVWQDWAYGRFQHLFGRLTYAGRPVYGLHSTRTGAPLDGYGRNLYLDTLDSSYGPGWRRENSFLAHKPTGVFCYGFYPHRGAPGTGRQYRLTVEGPGVTPVVSWTVPAQGAFDRTRQDELRSVERSLGDRLCR